MSTSIILSTARNKPETNAISCWCQIKKPDWLLPWVSKTQLFTTLNVRDGYSLPFDVTMDYVFRGKFILGMSGHTTRITR